MQSRLHQIGNYINLIEVLFFLKIVYCSLYFCFKKYTSIFQVYTSITNLISEADKL